MQILSIVVTQTMLLCLAVHEHTVSNFKLIPTKPHLMQVQDDFRCAENVRLRSYERKPAMVPFCHYTTGIRCTEVRWDGGDRPPKCKSCVCAVRAM